MHFLYRVCQEPSAGRHGHERGNFYTRAGIVFADRPFTERLGRRWIHPDGADPGLHRRFQLQGSHRRFAVRGCANREQRSGVGSLVDAKLAGQIPEARLRASFGWLVLLMGVFLLVQDVPRAFVLPAILAAMVLATLVGAGQRKRKLRETTQFPATVPEE